MTRGPFALPLHLVFGLALGPSPLAYAAEGGAGFYLLGSKGPAAAIMPPAGFYIQNDFYLYSGRASGNLELPTGGRLAIGVEGTAAIEMPTFLWVLPDEVLGGAVGFTATFPIGWKETSASATLSGPDGPATGAIDDSIFTYGDPVIGGMIGWHQGNFHWQTGAVINVPVGDYQAGELSNIAFNHWGADVFAAFTWLNPEIGLDLSGVLGMTFNAENPATDYRTGNELHFEWAAVQHFNTAFDAGLVGYVYEQVTGDSGSGASGPFKGRALALGATVGWNFALGETPVSTRLKYFHEFETINRVEGDALFFTLTAPLGTMGAAAE